MAPCHGQDGFYRGHTGGWYCRTSLEAPWEAGARPGGILTGVVSWYTHSPPVSAHDMRQFSPTTLHCRDQERSFLILVRMEHLKSTPCTALVLGPTPHWQGAWGRRNSVRLHLSWALLPASISQRWMGKLKDRERDPGASAILLKMLWETYNLQKLRPDSEGSTPFACARPGVVSGQPVGQRSPVTQVPRAAGRLVWAARKQPGPFRESPMHRAKGLLTYLFFNKHS